MNLVSFGKALEALKEGKRVQRLGWNGKGMFIFMQVPAKIDVETVVPNMQSLPKSVKDYFYARFIAQQEFVGDDTIDYSKIQYKNQLAIVYPDFTIYGWVASPSDILEEDWIILD